MATDKFMLITKGKLQMYISKPIVIFPYLSITDKGIVPSFYTLHIGFQPIGQQIEPILYLLTWSHASVFQEASSLKLLLKNLITDYDSVLQQLSAIQNMYLLSTALKDVVPVFVRVNANIIATTGGNLQLMQSNDIIKTVVFKIKDYYTMVAEFQPIAQTDLLTILLSRSRVPLYTIRSYAVSVTNENIQKLIQLNEKLGNTNSSLAIGIEVLRNSNAAYIYGIQHQATTRANNTTNHAIYPQNPYAIDLNSLLIMDKDYLNKLVVNIDQYWNMDLISLYTLANQILSSTASYISIPMQTNIQTNIQPNTQNQLFTAQSQQTTALVPNIPNITVNQNNVNITVDDISYQTTNDEIVIQYKVIMKIKVLQTNMQQVYTTQQQTLHIQAKQEIVDIQRNMQDIEQQRKGEPLFDLDLSLNTDTNKQEQDMSASQNTQAHIQTSAIQSFDSLLATQFKETRENEQDKIDNEILSPDDLLNL